MIGLNTLNSSKMNIPTLYFYTVNYPEKEELYEEVYCIEKKQVSAYTINHNELVLVGQKEVSIHDISTDIAIQIVKDDLGIEIGLEDLTQL